MKLIPHRILHRSSNLSAHGRSLLLALHLLCIPIAQAAEPVPSTAVSQQEMEKLLATYALIKQGYVGQPDDKKLFDGAIAGMLASLDAHSQYLNQDDMRDMDRESAGEYVGIGIDVEVDRDQIHVLSSIEGSPAERAGIQPGDLLVSIDGVPVAGVKDSEVGRRMHGAAGSVVDIGVMRGGRLRTLRITRAAVHDDTVSLRTAAPGVAWVRISAFGGTTGADLAAVLSKLDAQGAPRGLVLDLRNNPGGMVPAAVSVAAAFLAPHAVLFSARGRLPGSDATVTADPRFYRDADQPDVLAGLPAWTRSVPLTVLVNGASASAAELVAAALQDNGRATLVGSQTFGKGSIQSIVPLDADSGIKFTVARYFTPKGREIQARGVTPDVVVQARAQTSDELLLREADLANHLPAQEPGAQGAAIPRAPFESSRMFGTSQDKALQTAVALLAQPQPQSQTRSAGLAGLLRQWSGSRASASAP